jgi:hypothetical protein
MAGAIGATPTASDRLTGSSTASMVGRMSAHRTAWHPPFAALIRERAPSNVEVEAEVMLTLEPQKADLLLIHRHGERIGEGQVLRKLWPMLSKHTLVEYKSVARPPRPGDWIRLQGYASQYHAPRFQELDGPENLSLVLVTASMTPTLTREAAEMGWGLVDLGGGYYRVDGWNYASFLVLLDEVSDAEQDPLLGAFGHRTLGVDATSKAS